MYEKYYNLNAKPFRLSPDPRFLFRSKAHTKALAFLGYGLQSGEGFIVIIGGVGAGKTTLARTILSSVDKSRVLPVQLVTSQLESDDMLRLVAAALGLAHQGLQKSTLLRGIEDFLMARAREGKRVLLLVDEVQNLSRGALEELRMLSNFQYGERALLQSFLLGQNEFSSTLHSPGMEQFRQRIIAAYHLGALSETEVREYIVHRLRLCGWKEDPQIADGVFGKIFEYTAGVPRRINKFCDRLFLYGCVEEKHVIDEADVELVIEEESQEIQVTNLVSAESPKDPEGSPGGREIYNNVQALRPENAIGIDNARLQALEKKVGLLEDTIRNDRKRFQRMLMMLALSDDKDINLADMMKNLIEAGKQ